MRESHFNIFVGLQGCNFSEMSLQHRCFPVNIAKYVNTYFEEYLHLSTSPVRVPKIFKIAGKLSVVEITF